MTLHPHWLGQGGASVSVRMMVMRMGYYGISPPS